MSDRRQITPKERPEDALAATARRQGGKVLAAVLRPRTKPLADALEAMQESGMSDAEIISRLQTVQARLRDVEGLKVHALAKYLSAVALRAYTTGAQAKRAELEAKL